MPISVDADVELVLLVGEVLEEIHTPRRGVVDEDVQPTELLYRGAHRIAGLRGVAHIHRDSSRCAARLFDDRSRFLGGSLVDIRRRDFRSCAREKGCYLTPDSAACAGDDRAAPGQVDLDWT